MQNTVMPRSPRIEPSEFPVVSKWPLRHPDRMQRCSLPTPDDVKVSIMLEEIGLPYEPPLVDFAKSDQGSPEFRSLNPNAKIPATIDPDGPGGAPLCLFESDAILVYRADKIGKLLAPAGAARYETRVARGISLTNRCSGSDPLAQNGITPCRRRPR